MSGRRRVAIVCWVMTTAMQAAVALAITAGRFLDRMLAGQDIDPQAWAAGIAAVWGVMAISIAYATVGLVLIWRGGARVAWVLIAGGLTFGAVAFGYIVGGLLVMQDPDAAAANAIFVLGPSLIPVGYALILPALALAFPHGSLPSRRWRWPVALAVAALATATVIRLTTPGAIAGTPSHNPFGVDAMPAGADEAANLLTAIGLTALTLLAVACIIVRYRRGSELERLQLRWFLAAVLLAAVPVVVAPNVGGLAGPLWLLAALVGLLLVPVSVGIAVTRYHLYEIDRLISRSATWALLTATLIATYAAAVLVLQTVLTGVTQGQTLAVAVSTLLAAALFQPLHVRLQRAMDRRFDRGRYDAERTAVAFADRLRDEVDLRSVTDDLASTIGRSLRPAGVALWLRTSGDRG